ncbi:MAG: extracellular solute-binding protein [Clostridiales Family XIII bacterium]|jgi:raffinose/stachyose/melibiose transport system substrate-binding protein|nr:extracellular solute-binding protein [Clostridiales Family XIII bacterium]
MYHHKSRQSGVGSKGKKALLFVLALVIAPALSLGACSGGSAGGDSGSGAESGETLSMLMLRTNEPGMNIVLEDFAEEFPDIKIEAEFIGDIATFDSQVTSTFAAGNGVDMIHLIAGGSVPPSVQRFADAGHILDLSDQPWVSGMYEPAKDLMMYDGKVYAKDFGFCPLASLMYDKDYFEENDLTPPTTFDELVALCEEIKALGRIPISWGAAELAVNNNNVFVMAGNNVMSKDSEWMQKRLDGRVTFADDADWKRTLEQLKQLIDLGAFAPGAAAMNQTEMISDFAAGNTAMMFTYGGMAGLVKQETPDFNIGMIAFPGLKAEDTRVMLQSSGGLCINSKLKNTEAAYTFLDFWSRPEESAKFAEAANVISASQAVSGDLGGTYAEMAPVFKAGGTIPDATAALPNMSFSNEAGASVQGLFTGQKTVEQCLADFDTFFEKE